MKPLMCPHITQTVIMETQGPVTEGGGLSAAVVQL